LVCPKVLVCLDCGFSGFTTPATGLAILASNTTERKASRHQVGGIVLCA
jgi:hypothetical protein